MSENTYFPFELLDERDSKYPMFRLIFNNWDWVKEKFCSDEIGDFYFNGYGVQSLVLASILNAGLDIYPDGLEPNSEGDTCLFMIETENVALETAKLAADMINDKNLVNTCIQLAKDNDIED